MLSFCEVTYAILDSCEGFLRASAKVLHSTSLTTSFRVLRPSFLGGGYTHPMPHKCVADFVVDEISILSCVRHFLTLSL